MGKEGDERRVWVGGLPSDINDKELKDAFSSFGRIEDVIIRHSEKDTFAFITFSDERAVEEAKRKMDQNGIFGRPIKVNYVIKPGETVSKGKGKGRSRSRSSPPRQRDRSRSRDRSGKDGKGGKGSGKGGYKDDRGRRDRSWHRDDDRGRHNSNEKGRGRDDWDDRGKGRHNDGKGRGRDDWDDRGRSRDRDEGRGGRYDDRDKSIKRNPKWSKGKDGKGKDGKGSKGADRGRYDDWGDRDRGKGGGKGRDDRRRDDYYDSRKDDRDDRRRNDYYDSRRDDKGKGKGKMSKSDKTQSARVWIGGLPKDITEDEINREFRRFGNVTEVRIRHSEKDTFAFAQFETQKHADEAIYRMDQSKVYGTPIKVAGANADPDKGKGGGGKGGGGGGKGGGGRSSSRSPRDQRYRDPSQDHSQNRSASPLRRERSASKGTRRVVVVKLQNLPMDMKEDELQDVGTDYGRVLHVKLWDPPGGDCKHGLLEYESAAAATKAIEELDGRRMQGWEMRLKAYQQQ